MPQGDATNIQFRLSGQVLKELEKLAKAYELSPGQFARRIVVEYLEDAERLRTREKLSALEVSQKKLREDLAVAVEAMLVGAGKVSKDEAHEWVNENLRSE